MGLTTLYRLLFLRSNTVTSKPAFCGDELAADTLTYALHP